MGDIILATNVVLMQFVNWMSYGIDGFAYATESLVGKYKGAKSDNAVKTVIRQSFVWSGTVSLIYGAIYLIWGADLFTLFSDDDSLRGVALGLLPYIAAFPILAFASYMWDGVFVGLTATTSMRNAMILALVVYLSTYYALPTTDNGSHIWVALSTLMVARAVFQYVYYKRDGLEMR